MKLIIDIPKEKYEWIKMHNLNIDNDSIVGAIANGIPYEERPQGEWITGGKDVTGQYFYDEFICNQCFVVVTDKSNFCPKCGADMRGGVDMRNIKKETTFDDYLKEQLKDPEFRKEWEKLCDEDTQKEGAEE